MPATAAIDNETLDHLLSVVDEELQYKTSVAIRKVVVILRHDRRGEAAKPKEARGRYCQLKPM